ncbi:MAG: thermonuclease family protein [Kiritimatiellae bacterium]|nr:thermonuclease family protein [Kiritimatiellia bacterium]
MKPWVRRLGRVCAALALVTIAAEAASRRWDTKKGCRLTDVPFTDADSLNVKWEREEFVLRLHHVDAPCADERLSQRNTAHLRYFGITAAESTEVGKEAVKFVRKTLPREFVARAVDQDTVGTSNQPVRYGTITTADGRDLAELLVQNGFAIIRGFNVAEEGADKIQKLKELELEAKTEKRGAWKLSHR